MGAPLQAQEPAVAAASSSNQAPSKDALEATYSSLIQQHLSVLCVENATFLAERLVAMVESTNSLYLLAMCYYRSGNPRRAQAVLSGSTNQTPAMKYLLAKCLYDLEEYGAAEEVLLEECRMQYRQAFNPDVTDTETESMDEWILAETPCPIPNGAAGLALLGSTCRKSHRKQRSIGYFKMSLQLDPTLWTSYAALCEMGAADCEATSVFGVEFPAVTSKQDDDSAPPFELSATPATALQPMELVATTPSSASSSYLHKTSLFQTGRKSTKQRRPPPSASMQQQPSLFETPNLTPIPCSSDSNNKSQISRARQVASRLYYEPSPETTPPYVSNKKQSFLGGIERTMLAKSRLNFSSSETPAPEPKRKQPRNLFPPPSSKKHNNIMEKDAAVVRESEIKVAVPDAADEESLGVEKILELLCVLGTAYKQLCQFRCREALQTFHQLPSEQFHTGWVLHQVGRAYFEIADYQNAKRSLEQMQQIEPHRMKGLEVLSTTLWHLKKEVELSHLAQRAVDFDRLSAEAWCVVGNCFSLQKEHETALTFFRRSIQLDPSFTYSHTLSGHEYVANEDFDKAVACYRDAICVDERHYNAWYGLGAIYYRQEKYDLAEYHFKKAISINPQSSVLLCHLGMAQHANGMAYRALDTLEDAFRLDPRNPQARYQRATIYMALERHHEALAELKKVRDAAPRESSVHFAMGRVLKRIGRPEEAMRCFLTALDLDPKDNNLIKSAMDKMDEPDVDEEVSAF